MASQPLRESLTVISKFNTPASFAVISWFNTTASSALWVCSEVVSWFNTENQQQQPQNKFLELTQQQQREIITFSGISSHSLSQHCSSLPWSFSEDLIELLLPTNFTSLFPNNIKFSATFGQRKLHQFWRYWYDYRIPRPR